MCSGFCVAVGGCSLNWSGLIHPNHHHDTTSTAAAAVQRVEVGTLERAVKLSNKDAKLTKEHLRPLQVRVDRCY